MSNIRFIDSLKVGAYQVQGSTSGDSTGSIDITNNVNNYILTSTGTNTINGEASLQFDGTNLGIGGPSSGARFEINDDSGADLMLITKNNGAGIKVDNSGVLQLLEFSSLPSPVEGGIVYSSSNFYIGL